MLCGGRVSGVPIPHPLSWSQDPSHSESGAPTRKREEKNHAVPSLAGKKIALKLTAVSTRFFFRHLFPPKNACAPGFSPRKATRPDHRPRTYCHGATLDEVCRHGRALPTIFRFERRFNSDGPIPGHRTLRRRFLQAILVEHLYVLTLRQGLTEDDQC